MCSYWIFTFSGSGVTTPFQLRITDQFGQRIVETGTSIEPSYMWSGTHQFPVDSTFTGILRPDGTFYAAAPAQPFIVANYLHYAAPLPAEVAIVDVQGRRVARMTAASRPAALKLPALPGAVYYVWVSNKQSSSLLRWSCVR